MSSPAPKSPELSDKSRKYDRQIRLWGEHGQTLLENAQICLINASALGTEILKGVVLPGIGGFTILDQSLVNEEDIGCNFFLDPASVGQSRAKCCMQFLQELNADVNGDYVDENVDNILDNNPEFFKNFDVIVATTLNERSIVKLSNLLWDMNIPLIVSRSIGFYGVARLQIREHCIIETHPDNKHGDLRLEHPFESLRKHIQVTELTSKIPWLVVLSKFMRKWEDCHDGKLPANYKEKSQLRDMIHSAMTADEENYEEAAKAVNASFGGGRPSAAVMDILNDDCCVHLNKDSSAFWILAKALKEFVEHEGKGFLPIPGSIPDMTADTVSYITLQNIYRNQAAHDAEIVYRKAEQLLKELNRPNDFITEKDARLFCRESANLAVIRGTKISEEYEKGSAATIIANNLQMPDNLMEHYIALRALDKFQSEFGYIPGECQVETDTSRIKSIGGKMVNDLGISYSVRDDLAHEICRYGGAEIHSVSAFLGGCIAQELIKIISKQYKPFDNTFIYDGTTLQTEIYKL